MPSLFPLLRAVVLCAAFAVVGSGGAAAQGAPQGGHGIVTLTMGARLFGNAELQLISACQSGDQAGIDKLLAPDFEQRTPAAPTAPMPREDWVKAAGAQAARSAGIGDIAVHFYDSVAVASFVWRHPGADFVVDVWQKKEGSDDWQLAVRYLIPAPVPAAPAHHDAKLPATPARASAAAAAPGASAGSADARR